MKPINEYGLQECLEALRTGSWEIVRIADRIHELTRWIPIEEQMPTESDIGLGGRFWVYINGLVTDACFAGGIIHVWDDESFNSGWSEYNKNDYRTAFTHWKRIDTP